VWVTTQPNPARPRVVAVLGVLAGALIAAFVLAPPVLAARGPVRFAGERDLAAALQEAFVAHWRSGDRAPVGELAAIVDYWFRYHLVKAVIAALLLGVLGVLAVQLWRAFLRTGRPAAVAAGGVLVTTLAFSARVVVMANIQGAVAPFASLLPMLLDGPADPALTRTLAQVQDGLTGSAGRTPAPLAAMVGDFATYHVALAVVAAAGALVLSLASTVLWRRFRAAGTPRKRRLVGSFGVLTSVLVLVFLLSAAANVSTAAEPEPALLAFFRGGW
jgi:hypothetical protein